MKHRTLDHLIFFVKRRLFKTASIFLVLFQISLPPSFASEKMSMTWSFLHYINLKSSCRYHNIFNFDRKSITNFFLRMIFSNNGFPHYIQLNKNYHKICCCTWTTNVHTLCASFSRKLSLSFTSRCISRFICWLWLDIFFFAMTFPYTFSRNFWSHLQRNQINISKSKSWDIS